MPRTAHGKGVASLRRLLAAGTVLFVAGAASAEEVPDNLASFAATIYRQGQAQLDDPAANAEHQAVVERVREVLRRAGIRYWARQPVKLTEGAVELARTLKLDLAVAEDRALFERLLGLSEEELRKALAEAATAAGETPDEASLNELVAAVRALAAFDSLPQRHHIEFEDGESLELRWTPGTGDLVIRARSDGSRSTPEYDAAIAGKTVTRVDPETGDLAIEAAPDDMSVRTLVASELKRLRASLLDDWRSSDGTVLTISAADERAGDITPPPTDYAAEIEDLKAKIEAIEDIKVFVWQRRDTGERLAQERFRRLDDAYEYLGEELRTPDAAATIEQLSGQIAELEALQKGGGVPPVQSFDPVNFEADRSGAAGQALRMTAIAPDGFEYEWDEVAFDGRRITARRTFRDVRELNEPLPATVKTQLIASWSPPTWVELEATIDPRTEAITLEGLQWGLHVHYRGGGMMGGGYSVVGIDTPYSWPVAFAANDYLVAAGAAEGVGP